MSEEGCMRVHGGITLAKDVTEDASRHGRDQCDNSMEEGGHEKGRIMLM